MGQASTRRPRRPNHTEVSVGSTEPPSEMNSYHFLLAYSIQDFRKEYTNRAEDHEKRRIGIEVQ